MKFPPQQEAALKSASAWMFDKSAPQVFYLGGYAGVGKTTLIKHLVKNACRRWLFASFTGKAAHVMRQKGCEGARTIHSLIYRPNGESRATEIAALEQKLDTARKMVRDETMLDDSRTPSREAVDMVASIEKKLLTLINEREPQYALWVNSPLADPDVEGIVIDECSMVDDRLGEDLESFGKKILVVGDPAQLPPVGAGGRYTKRTPDVMLTEIHRQANESGILRLATLVREGHTAAHFQGTEDCRVLFKEDFSRDELAGIVMTADQVLVGRNRTRRAFNQRQRALLGMTEMTPVRGDRLVCLKNDRSLGLFNGSMWRVAAASSDINTRTCNLEIDSEDGIGSLCVESSLHHMVGLEDELQTLGWDRKNLAEFDYSYALTVHKSQGSQWDSVVLFDESSAFGREVGRRWLYTGITRAARKLTVVV